MTAPHFSIKLTRRFLVASVTVLVVILVAANIGLAIYFQNHFYPGSKIGNLDVSYQAPDQVRTELEKIVTQPLQVRLGQQIATIQPSDLGVGYNVDQSIVAAGHKNPPLVPMLAWFSASRQSELSYSLDPTKFQAKVNDLTRQYMTRPTDASLNVENGKAVLKPDVAGYSVTAGQLASQLRVILATRPNQPTNIAGQLSPAKVTKAMLEPAVASMNQKVAVSIKLTYLENAYQPTPDTIGSWLTTNDQHQVIVDQSRVQAYLKTIAADIDQQSTATIISTTNGAQTTKQLGKAGLTVDQPAAVAAITDALNQQKALNYQLVTHSVEPTVQYVQTTTVRVPTYQYCVAARQVDTSLLTEFSQGIAQTLADPRGWSLGGKIKFEKVDSGCTMTLWLSAASALTSFSSGCSDLYSCRVGTNVIINVDRWLNATPTWVDNHGTLADYRALVINHEVGHWLGFDHLHCSGPGQPAPVMQQQSIDLEGCTINAWPLQRELDMLRAMKGL